MKTQHRFILNSFFCLLATLTACSGLDDCVKSSGAMATKPIDLQGQTFSTIIVNRGIALVVEQGPNFEVTVKAGQNLVDDIQVSLSNNILTLKDGTSCNWTREYGQTTVYVTAPDLVEIHSKTELEILSSGILSYPHLHLFAMDKWDGYDGVGNGDFKLQVECPKLTIENNDMSRYYITGNVVNLWVNFYEWGGIFYGQDLIANSIQVYHRGTNDLYVHPVESITGSIYNLGNIYCSPRPPIVNVQEYYRGHIYFN
ncbi:MAG: DUF2807 domain-containing protein [Flavobacterium sp.]|nr:DUF2807 domain-containing protein [Flavobacterium sp.]